MKQSPSWGADRSSARQEIPCATVGNTEAYSREVEFCRIRPNRGWCFDTIAKFRKATTTFVMPVCRHGTTRLPLDEFWRNLTVEVFFQNLSIKLKFFWNLSRVSSTIHEDLCAFVTISRRILLRIRNALEKSCKENQSTHFMFSNFFIENRAFYEIMWKNMVEPDSS